MVSTLKKGIILIHGSLSRQQLVMRELTKVKTPFHSGRHDHSDHRICSFVDLGMARAGSPRDLAGVVDVNRCIRSRQEQLEPENGTHYLRRTLSVEGINLSTITWET
jgi:hypothetical protein